MSILVHTMAPPRCRFCGSESHRSFAATEGMFGTGERFDYLECDDCRSLSIAKDPDDLGRYYPEKYYSFGSAERHWSPQRRGLRKWFSEARATASIWDRPRLGALLQRVSPGIDFPHLRRMLGCIPHLTARSRILDIGCGNGQFLFNLLSVGFTSLTGVDPYLREGFVVDDRLRVHAGEARELPAGQFDLVTMHHSLEHISDPVAALVDVRRLLANGGTCLVRVPVADSEPCREFGDKWVELDAPRHLAIPSRRGMEKLAEAAGFRLWHMRCDSDAFAYWASALYERGLSLVDAATNEARLPESHFSPEEMAEFGRRAAAANAAGEGGRAAFYLSAIE